MAAGPASASFARRCSAASAATAVPSPDSIGSPAATSPVRFEVEEQHGALAVHLGREALGAPHDHAHLGGLRVGLLEGRHQRHRARLRRARPGSPHRDRSTRPGSSRRRSRRRAASRGTRPRVAGEDRDALARRLGVELHAEHLRARAGAAAGRRGGGREPSPSPAARRRRRRSRGRRPWRQLGAREGARRRRRRSPRAPCPRGRPTRTRFTCPVPPRVFAAALLARPGRSITRRSGSPSGKCCGVLDRAVGHEPHHACRRPLGLRRHLRELLSRARRPARPERGRVRRRASPRRRPRCGVTRSSSRSSWAHHLVVGGLRERELDARAHAPALDRAGGHRDLLDGAVVARRPCRRSDRARRPSGRRRCAPAAPAGSPRSSGACRPEQAHHGRSTSSLRDAHLREHHRRGRRGRVLSGRRRWRRPVPGRPGRRSRDEAAQPVSQSIDSVGGHGTHPSWFRRTRISVSLVVGSPMVST